MDSSSRAGASSKVNAISFLFVSILEISTSETSHVSVVGCGVGRGGKSNGSST